MVTLTEAAATKIRELCEQQSKPEHGLRVRVVGGGCSGMQYQLGLTDQARDGDQVVESHGVKVYVDPKSLLYVAGSEVDYVETLMESGFKINNPNVAGSCGCGHSFHTEKH